MQERKMMNNPLKGTTKEDLSTTRKVKTRNTLVDKKVKTRPMNNMIACRWIPMTSPARTRQLGTIRRKTRRRT